MFVLQYYSLLITSFLNKQIYIDFNVCLQLPGLLDGCYIYFQGNFLNPKKEEIAELVKKAGAVVISREPKPDQIKDTQLSIPYHAKPDSELSNCSHFIVKSDKNVKSDMLSSRLCVVPITWLLDSIAKFELIDLVQYK